MARTFLFGLMPDSTAARAPIGKNTALHLAICRPGTPMRRADDDPFAGRGLDPAVRYATAGENQGMDMPVLNDRDLEISIIRGRRNRFPHRPIIHRFRSRLRRCKGAALLKTSIMGATHSTALRQVKKRAPTPGRPTHFRVPAAQMTPELCMNPPSKKRARRECRVSYCTRSLVCKVRKHTSVVTTGEAETPTFPARWC
jgi:hypothetical protein